MAALADLGDETDKAEAVRWFYAEPNGNGGSTAQSVFFTRLDQRHPRAGKEILRLLAADPALDRLRPMDVIYLALLLEKTDPGFSFDHSWRDERVDDIRGLLRAHFGIGTSGITMLKSPEKHLDKPEWSVELDGLGHDMALAPDGSLLAVSMNMDDGGVRVLSAGNGKEKQRIAAHRRGPDVCFSSDSSRLLFSSSRSSSEIGVWDARSGELSWQAVEPQSGFQLAADRPFALFEGDNNHDERFFWVDQTTFKTVWSRNYRRNIRVSTAVSPDAQWIALVDEGLKTIQLIDAGKEAEFVTEFSGHASFPARFAFSPDSTRLISVSEDERVILWDVAKKSMQSMFRGSGLQFGPAGFTADSRCFFVNSQPSTLGVYAMDGTPLFGIKCSGSWMKTALPSRDGRFLFILVQHPSIPMGGTNDRSRIECWRVKPS